MKLKGQWLKDHFLPVLAGAVELEGLLVFGLAPAEGPATLLSALLHSSPEGTTFQ